MSSQATDIIPSLTGENTQAQVYEQDITYDQSGVTYDQAGIVYGGVYNSGEDIIPAISLAVSPIPSISGYADIYTPYIPPPSEPAGLLIGILGLTYPGGVL